MLLKGMHMLSFISFNEPWSAHASQSTLRLMSRLLKLVLLGLRVKGPETISKSLGVTTTRERHQDDWAYSGPYETLNPKPLTPKP